MSDIEYVDVDRYTRLALGEDVATIQVRGTARSDGWRTWYSRYSFIPETAATAAEALAEWAAEQEAGE